MDMCRKAKGLSTATIISHIPDKRGVTEMCFKLDLLITDPHHKILLKFSCLPALLEAPSWFKTLVMLLLALSWSAQKNASFTCSQSMELKQQLFD